MNYINQKQHIMRQTAIMIMMVICWAAAAAQVLPGDGEGLTIYDLDVEIGDCDGGLCDLSGATVTSETGMRFEYFGDTLVRRVTGPRADWLRISNDTVWSVGTDTRRESTRYSHGLPYLLPCKASGMADSLRHSMFLSIDRDNLVCCRYSSRRGEGFILPGGDTIPSTYCIETETCDTTGTMRHRRWYAEGAVWPVVEQVTVCSDQEEYSTVNICPPEEQPRHKAAVKGTGGSRQPRGIYGILAQLHGTDPDPGSPTWPAGGFDITVTHQCISVTGEGTDRATVRLFDTAGRLWHEGTASSVIPTGYLAPGVYLLQIVSDTATFSTKLTITGR